VTERLGDVVINCTGNPGTSISGNLTVTLNTTVTNRILSGSSVDAVLAVNAESSQIPPATLTAVNQVSFAGLQFQIGTAGSASLRISNLRGDASFGGTPSLPGGGGGILTGTPIVAQLAFNAGSLLNFTSSRLEVGVPQRGLYVTSLTALVPAQAGSPLPQTIGFSELLQAGTTFASTRVSEGLASAFEPRQEHDDVGTRIAFQFAGYPANARLFVPAVIAGSSAMVPTAAGDFGGTVSGGRYVPGSRTLLLVRAGVGASVPTDDSVLNTMTEVELVNGSGSAVYEVMDANPQLRESAEIPVFLGLPRSQEAGTATLQAQVSFAPLSNVWTASDRAPIPRFIDLQAPTDCGVFYDCSLYTPKLGAPPVNTTFTLVQGAGAAQRLIPLSNEGGGNIMPWAATVNYENGSDWLQVDPMSGVQPVLIRMTAIARTDMQPGTYRATLIIDAGLAGEARYPITLTVTAPPQAKPVITAVQHGATFQAGPIARGSFITLRGSNFGTSAAGVTIDNQPARVVYTGTDQINLQVPEQIGTNSAQIVVTAGGVASDPVRADVVDVNPGIFTPGILNQDGTVNSETNPANTGSYVQIFATGLLPPDGSGVVEARVHDRTLTNLPFAGPAPGISGLQQVNLQVPADLPTMQAELSLCTSVFQQRVCSPPVRVHLRHVP
jgi:uncharacterized protein (TIGR03437 family)